MGAKKGEDLEPVGSIRSSDSHRLYSLKETVSLLETEKKHLLFVRFNRSRLMCCWNVPSHSLFCIVSRIVFPAYCATVERGSDSRGQFDIDVTNSTDSTRKAGGERTSFHVIFNFRGSIFSSNSTNNLSGDKCISIAVSPLPIRARIPQFSFRFQASSIRAVNASVGDILIRPHSLHRCCRDICDRAHGSPQPRPQRSP